MGSQQYTDEAHRQLNDCTNYILRNILTADIGVDTGFSRRGGHEQKGEGAGNVPSSKG